ncbi:MAG: L-lactate permease [Myxococcales bacterium]
MPFGPTSSALLAALPLFWLLLGLGVLRMPAWRACVIGLAATMLVAGLAWKVPATTIALSAVEGALLGLWPIVSVIFAAMFTYNLAVATGAMDRIRALLSGVSADRRVQALLIAWGFSGFLEGAAGFGTAVAIPAAMLIGLGFEPRKAAILCLVANTVPVAFGGVGLPVITLAKVTDTDLARVTYYTALQLTPLVVVLPLILIPMLTGGLAGLRGVVGLCLASGIAFAVPQLVLARFVGPELTAIAGSIAAMPLVALWARFWPAKTVWRFPGEPVAEPLPAGHTNVREQLVAWAPYLLMLVFILGTGTLVPPVHDALARAQSAIPIVPGAKPLTFAWVLNPGTLIFLGGLAGGLIQGARGAVIAKVLRGTAKQLAATTLTVTAIVALAQVMGHTGMSAAIAVALAGATGKAFPALSPLIGALGTFLTGSNTSSNVLFGALQKQTALQIGADPNWLVAANAAGATAGKMISPQSIAVAASATAQQGREGELLRGTLAQALLYTVVLGAIVVLLAP